MIKPISKKKYYETISDQIQEVILSGEWPEGSRVPTEDELAEIFNVGRGSIREAITNLQISGVLVSSPGIGTYVSDNAIACINNQKLAEMLKDPACLDDMVEARRILEPEIAAHAAIIGGEEDHQRIRAAIEQAKEAAAQKDWENFGHQFHMAICQTMKNRIILSFFITIEEPTRKLHKAEYTEENAAEIISEYEAILDAIIQKDPRLAGKLMRSHLR